ncbi:molluscan insulin-related peptide(s) receptor [Schistosoma japonicum]|nr:molluscan insulin-related peptide(s) receptor [Schistosoma japonicum]
MYYPIHWLLSIYLFMLNILAQHDSTDLGFSQEVACTRADVRHSSSLTKLSRCTVIEGDLFIVFTRIPRDASLPFLKEVTGSLLVYDTEGPEDLSILLPNLTLVRGQTLVFGYSVVIKSTSFKSIGLPSLRVIQQGGVRIDSNPQLCYVETIDWKVILQNQSGDVSSIKIVKNGLICSNICSSSCSVNSPNNTQHSSVELWRSPFSDILPTDGHCWSMNECQSICPVYCTLQNLTCTMKRPYKCCHPECLAGCYGDGPSECVACKNVMHDNQCISKCPSGTFKYLNRRCVTEYQCLVELPNMMYSDSPYISEYYANNSFPYNDMTRMHSNFTIFNGSCLLKCPVGYKKSLKTGHCYACGDQCELKHCREFLIYNLKALDTLTGCYSAKAIYLSIQDGKPETVANLLDRAFKNLKVIHHSLRIVRSSVLENLNFLQHVHSIGQIGENVSSHPIVFELFGNDNLRNLWPIAKDANNIEDDPVNSLQILSNGLIRITQNRQLCPEKIFQLFESNIIKSSGNNNITLTQAEREMITITNGDLAYCNWSEFNVTVSNRSSHSVRVTWPHPSTIHFTNKSVNTNFSDGSNSSHVDEVVLIYLFYQSAPNDLPDIIKGRRVYDKNSWRMLTTSCDLNPGDSISSFSYLELDCGLTISELEAATRYAIYVEMKFPLKQTGAVSNLVYFTTLSVNPTPPQYPWLEPLNQNSLRLTWMPPVKPSGIIDAYLIWIRILEDNPSEYLTQDFCTHRPNWIQSGWDKNSLFKHSRQINLHNDYCDSCLSCPNLLEIEQLSNTQAIPSLDKNYWPSSVSRWMTDNFGNILPVIVDEIVSLKSDTVGLIVQKNASTFQHISHFQMDYEKKCIHSVNENVKYLTGFPPFTRVLVEIQACLSYDSISYVESETKCHRPPPWSNLKSGTTIYLHQLHHQWSVCEYELCSPRSTVINRVNPHVESDKVPVASIHATLNGPGSIRITWSNPIKPNGLILHYLLRYRPRNHDQSYTDSNHSSSDVSLPWLTKCISMSHWSADHSEHALTSSSYIAINQKEVSRSKRGYNANSSTTDGGISIKDLSPGSYEFQILAVSLAGNGEWSPTVIFNIPFYTDHNGTINRQKLVYISIIIASSFLLLCFILAIIWYKARRYYFKATAWTSNNPDYCTIYEVDNWEINKDDVDVLHWKYPIGRGSFGTVYKGVVKQLKTPAKLLYNNPVNIPVAIKTISVHSTLFDHRDFINEACFMKQFQSYHLVRLLGLVTKTKIKHKSVTDNCIKFLHHHHFGKLCQFISGILPWTSTSVSSSSPNVKPHPLLSPSISSPIGKQMLDDDEVNCHTFGLSKNFTPVDDASLFNNTKSFGFNKVAPDSPLVIMQLMAKGDLASYLRYLGDKGQGTVNSSQAYLWATQIADGMAYLSAKQYVHRDLAARNCLVDSHLTVKIGDFGLCRDVYGRNYYHKTSHGKLPIRWMAPESLQTAYFTTQSDVWSYGVVLWEIVTMACLPYCGMSHEEVVRYILSGKTLLSNGTPTNCPELLRALMLHCWNFDPLKRPTFLGLCALLSPCFGDAKFRLASFFYHGEQSLVNNDRRSNILEAPAVSLGKLSISSNRDPAHILASALSTLFCGIDEDPSCDSNGRNFDPTNDPSTSLLRFTATTTSSSKSSPIFNADRDYKTHQITCNSSEDTSVNLNDNRVALSEVQCLLRLCGSDSNPTLPVFVDSESFPLILKSAVDPHKKALK